MQSLAHNSNPASPENYHNLKPQPFATFAEIGPTEARKLLKGNTRNRHLRTQRVKDYADQIRSGGWSLSHQGVAIDPNGVVLDGQHRLSAIIEADMAIVMLLSRNVPPEAQEVIDIQMPRNMADLVNTSRGLAGGDRLSNEGASAMKILIAEQIADLRISKPQLISAFDELDPYLRTTFDLFRSGSNPGRGRGIRTAPVHAAVASAIDHESVADLAAFTNLLMGREYGGEPWQKLVTQQREHLLMAESERKRSKSGDPGRWAVYLRIQRAIKRYCERSQQGKIQTPQQMTYPSPLNDELRQRILGD